MNFKSLFLAAFLIGSQAVPVVNAAENWPGWRGPRGDGTVLDAPNLPVAFSVGEDSVWKTEIPGIGHASPVIWGDRIFLVSADATTLARSLLCLDRISGKILWSKVVLEAPLEEIHRLNVSA